MRIARTFSITFLLLLIGAVGARAQVPGIDLQIVPRVGGYMPAGDLYEAQGTTVEFEPALALGLGVRLDFPLFPIDLRANVDYATGTELSFDGDGAPAVEQSAEATLLAVTADILIHPLPTPIVSPYLVAGAGIKRYGFETEDANADFFAGEENDFTLHAGIGLDIGLGPVAVTAEVSDYISWFSPPGDGDAGTEEETELQNDIFGTVGIRIGLF